MVDNINKTDVMATTARGATYPLIASLPQTSGCAILATTRDKRIAYSVAEDSSVPIDVSTMSNEDAALLLERKLPDPSLRDSRQDQLLAELENPPLAITQAAAYVKHYRVGVTRYLEFLRANPNKVLSDEQSESNRLDTRRDKSQTKAVYNTLQVSIIQLTYEHGIAVRILMVMAHFDGQCIPRYCLETKIGECFADHDLIEALSTLVSLGLVHICFSGAAYFMRKLVQGAAKSLGKDQRHSDIYSDTLVMAAELLSSAFPFGVSSRDWIKNCELYPHIYKVVNNVAWPASETIVRAQLLQRLGGHLNVSRRFAEATPFWR